MKNTNKKQTNKKVVKRLSKPVKITISKKGINAGITGGGYQCC